MLIELNPAEGAVMAPMSFGQERLWFVDGVVQDAALYNVRKALRLRGSVDVAALQESIDALVRRHEILRTSFSLVDDRPMQIVEPALHVPLASIDLSALSPSERETKLERVVREEGGRRFTLSAVPLLRAMLVRLAPQDHVLVLTLHHIITDEWSGDILYRELSSAYAAYCAGREPDFEELPIQYADYAVWQREWLQGDVLERQLAFWRDRLAGAPPRTELPLDRARTTILHAPQAGSESLVLPRALGEALHELGRRHGVTPFMLLLAAFRVLLFRYTGQSDLVVGSPVANRPRRELQNLIGFFVNTLLLRASVRAEDRFSDVLRNERETVLAAFEHQDVPFEKLVAELAPDRSIGGTPFVNVLFVVRHKGEHAPELGALQLGPVKLTQAKAKFDLTLN
ncbi:MAG: condensation domain-containing protein, partial [Candidatus Eremiobacteraeota bacterium]|nr:condensation domain-containing protein [Candidatus Eremiobacteraeota bacterium]